MNRPAMHWAAFVLSLVAVLSVAVALQSFSELENHVKRKPAKAA